MLCIGSSNGIDCNLDGDINVKIHTVAEREEFEKKAYYSDSELKQYPQRAVTFAYAVVDDKGERLFTDEQIPEISKWPAYITVPVHLKYNELNNIGPEKIEVIPAVSGFQMAATRMGWPLAEVETLTIHGRPLVGVLARLLLPSPRRGRRG